MRADTRHIRRISKSSRCTCVRILHYHNYAPNSRYRDYIPVLVRMCSDCVHNIDASIDCTMHTRSLQPEQQRRSLQYGHRYNTATTQYGHCNVATGAMCNVATGAIRPLPQRQLLGVHACVHACARAQGCARAGGQGTITEIDEVLQQRGERLLAHIKRPDEQRSARPLARALVPQRDQSRGAQRCLDEKGEGSAEQRARPLFVPRVGARGALPSVAAPTRCACLPSALRAAAPISDRAVILSAALHSGTLARARPLPRPIALLLRTVIGSSRITMRVQHAVAAVRVEGSTACVVVAECLAGCEQLGRRALLGSCTARQDRLVEPSGLPDVDGIMVARACCRRANLQSAQRNFQFISCGRDPLENSKGRSWQFNDNSGNFW